MTISLPYITLALLVCGLFVVRSRQITLLLLAIQIFLGFIYGAIDPKGFFAVTVFWGICALHWGRLPSKEWLNILQVFCLAAIAIGFANHLVPGFHNMKVLDSILVSPSSIPFTMYLNFDKTIVAVMIAVTSGLLWKQTKPFGLESWCETLLIAGFCMAFLVPLAVLGEYVAFEPKFPDSFGVWAFNNLLFVCFAEEVIFRGLIQGSLMRLATRYHIPAFIPIGVSSLLFALTLSGHLSGGPLFMGFAAVAGMFYGYAYYRTQRLESAIVAHFIVNLCHFLFFSYPAASAVIK